MKQSPYQMTDVSQEALVSSLILPDMAEMPNIILSISPCRSGTTVMLRVLAAMGADAYFQPLKNILRWQLMGQKQPWLFPAGRHKTIYIKETLGPYTTAESTFNPLDFLLHVGVPPSRLHVWIYGRAPLHSYASWCKWWGGKTTIEHFIASYQTTEQAYQQSIAAGIPTTVLTYEQFADHEPQKIISALSHRFGLPYTPQAVSAWQNLPQFGTTASQIILPEEPPIFITSGIHDAIEEATEFSYRSPSAAALSLVSKEAKQKIESAGLFALHQQWHETSRKDLNLLENLPQQR